VLVIERLGWAEVNVEAEGCWSTRMRSVALEVECVCLHGNGIFLQIKNKITRNHFTNCSEGSVHHLTQRLEILIPQFRAGSLNLHRLLLSVQGVDHLHDLVEPASETNAHQNASGMRQQRS